MAADPVSQHRNCAFCHTPSESIAARHVCPVCGSPQPLGPGEDYFSTFEVPRSFALDRGLLEKRFYEISRALHPDRFTTADPVRRKYSLERMSFLNEAYRTLKDPAALREYLLEREGVLKPDAGSEKAARGRIPLELTESWFDLQDALSEDPALARGKLVEFEAELGGMLRDVDRKIRELERSADEARGDGRHGILEGIVKETQTQSYLVSLSRDVERIKTRLAS